MTSLVLQQPTPDLVRKYVGLFEGDDALRCTDRTLSRLFTQYPSNRDIHEVLLKAAALNSMYVTSIYLIYDMAVHIHRLDIDDELERGSADLVNGIALATIGGKPRHCYSFASKYCSWHRPDDYPIYDSYVEGLVWAYQKQDGFAAFQRADLQTYARYKEIIASFRSYYSLQAFQFKELDKFLWGYGKEMLSNVATG